MPDLFPDYDSSHFPEHLKNAYNDVARVNYRFFNLEEQIKKAAPEEAEALIEKLISAKEESSVVASRFHRLWLEWRITVRKPCK